MYNDIIFELLDKERNRQTVGLELIASENYVSENVLKAVGSIATNKYAEGLPGKRYYGGCEFVDEIENLAIDRLKQLFGAVWANVQPHSGSQANAAVMLAVLNKGDKILGFDVSHGGHLTHGSPVNFSGKLYNSSFYQLNSETQVLDYDNIRATALKEKPKLIIAGASAYSRDWDYQEFRKIADEVGAFLLADISHPAGLIASGMLNNPVPHCHFITTTTHKTLRGPRGGAIMIGENFENPWGHQFKNGNIKKISNYLDSAVFPGSQGGPLEHVIAGKAVAFGEALQPEFKSYCNQVRANAKAMADAFLKKDYKIITNGTDNHLMLIDLRNKNITGKDAENALIKADITVNKNMVPFDNQSPFITSGIRIGTAAITTRGLKENDIQSVVNWIDEVITNWKDDEVLSEIAKNINHKMSDFPLFKY